MTRILAFVALAAAGVALAQQSAFESPRADLRAKFVERETHRYAMTRSMLMESPGGELYGSTVTSEFELGCDPTAEGASVPVRARYKAFALELRTANGLTTYDSQDPMGTNERGRGFADAGRVILRTVYELDVARDGVVTEMRAQNDNPLIEDEPIRSLLNHDALQREFMHLLSTRSDVEQPLVGHAWSTSVSTQVGSGIWMVVTHHYTLQDIEKDIAVIAIKSSAELVPQDPSMGQLRQRIAPNEMGGVVKWNTAEGVLEQAEIVQDYDIVTARDGLIPDRQRYVQSFTARRLR